MDTFLGRILGCETGGGGSVRVGGFDLSPGSISLLRLERGYSGGEGGG